MKDKIKTYSRDYKLKLVELCKSRGNVSAVSREYGVTINSLNRWIQEFDRYESGSFPGRGKPKMTEVEAEIAALKKEFVTRSMSRKGDCWDNAVAEGFFKSLKAEEVYETVYQNQKEAEIAIFEYIEGFYNRNGRHSALGYLTVNEFEKLKHAA